MKEIVWPAFSCCTCGLLLSLSAGCASLPDAVATPRGSRLSVEEMARLAPETARLSLDDLLAMANADATFDVIVARFRQSGVRFDLTPAQVIDLHQRGLPLPVLQAIHEEHEKALRADLAQLLIEGDQKCSREVAQVRAAERQCVLLNADPFYPGFYGTWGSLPYRRSGVFMGW